MKFKWRSPSPNLVYTTHAGWYCLARPYRSSERDPGRRDDGWREVVGWARCRMICFEDNPLQRARFSFQNALLRSEQLEGLRSRNRTKFEAEQAPKTTNTKTKQNTDRQDRSDRQEPSTLKKGPPQINYQEDPQKPKTNRKPNTLELKTEQGPTEPNRDRRESTHLKKAPFEKTCTAKALEGS